LTCQSGSSSCRGCWPGYTRSRLPGSTNCFPPDPCTSAAKRVCKMQRGLTCHPGSASSRGCFPGYTPSRLFTSRDCDPPSTYRWKSSCLCSASCEVGFMQRSCQNQNGQSVPSNNCPRTNPYV
jgi:hypothetical protein